MMVLVVTMAVAMPEVGVMVRMVAMRGAVRRAEIPPRRDGDPAAEGDEGDARKGIDEMAEARGQGEPGAPHHEGQRQGGKDMADSRLERGLRRLRLGPAQLAREQRDRRPM